MSYAKKNSATLLGLIIIMISFVVVGAWQFYEYVSFRDSSGILSTHGGTIHLAVALTMALLACGIGFLVSTVFLQHDTDDELHITSSPYQGRSIRKSDS